MFDGGHAPLLPSWSSSHHKKSAPGVVTLEPCCRTNGLYRPERLKSAKDNMDGIFTNFQNLKPNRSATSARRSLTVASVLCLLFMVAQAVGGYAAGSLAIMSDAAHLLSDFISLMISLLSLCLAKKQPSIRMTFGWHRAEVVGALISLCMIWGITATLVYVAILRLRTFKFNIKAELMLITASVGVCFNIIMALVLHKAGDIGAHGHSHGYSSELQSPATDNIADADSSSAETQGPEKKKSKHRLSVRAALLHVASDFLQSSAVLLAAVIIYCKPQLAFIDPMCTFLFSVLVLLTTVPILKEITTILMEGAPANIDLLHLVQALRKVEGIERVTNLRVWSLNTDRTACTVHITVDVMMHDWRTVLESASSLLSGRFHIDESTIQIVPLRETMLTSSHAVDCSMLVESLEQ